MSGEIPADLFDYLLRGTVEVGSDNPCSEWMDDKSWGGVQAIKQFEVRLAQFSPQDVHPLMDKASRTLLRLDSADVLLRGNTSRSCVLRTRVHVSTLSALQVFEKLSDDLLSNPKRFREW
jgi:hypothetical protein